MMKLGTFAVLVCALALTGCGKDDKSGGEDKGGAAKPAGKKAASGEVSLDKLGLKADAPGGSKVGDGPLGDGVMIQGPNLVVTIEEAGDMTPADLAAAKEDADMYSPLNWKEEKLADGWLVAFENKGGMGTNYWVKSRRTIGGKDYVCGTTASNPDQQKNAIAACKSLRQ